MPPDTIIVVLAVPPDKAAQVEREVRRCLGATFGPRLAPWIPGYALQHVTAARVNGHTAFDREAS